MQTADIPPNQTVYLNNLNEKIKKDELKKAIYQLMSQFGNILEVVALRTYKMRGQAWVIFEDLQGATRAVREMNNFMFFGKPLHVNFAKQKSDIVAKVDGTFVPRPKRKQDGDAEKPHVKDQQRKREKLAAQGQAAGAGAAPMQTFQQAAPMQVDRAPIPMVEPPNKILFVQNLPEETNQEMLSMLFSQHPGFREVRLIQGTSGIAFIEYEDEYKASAAMDLLQNFKITPTHLMRISFAKK